jgi:hypothetical protein
MEAKYSTEMSVTFCHTFAVTAATAANTLFVGLWRWGKEET